MALLRFSRVRPLLLLVGVLLLILAGLKVMSVLAIASLGETEETEHFVFYCDPKDRPLLAILPGALEIEYRRVSADLDYSLTQKVVVRIYPDLHRQHMSIGNPFPWPDNPNSNAGPGEIETISPGSYGTDLHLYTQGLVHELTHVFAMDIHPSLRRGWLTEGLASYEAFAGTLFGERMIAAIEEDVVSGRIPHFEDLANVTFPRFVELRGYEFSYAFVNFVASEYGMDTLRRMIRSPDDYKGVFGLTQEQVWARWVDYMKASYPLRSALVN